MAVALTLVVGAGFVTGLVPSAVAGEQCNGGTAGLNGVCANGSVSVAATNLFNPCDRLSSTSVRCQYTVTWSASAHGSGAIGSRWGGSLSASTSHVPSTNGVSDSCSWNTSPIVNGCSVGGSSGTYTRYVTNSMCPYSVTVTLSFSASLSNLGSSTGHSHSAGLTFTDCT